MVATAVGDNQDRRVLWEPIVSFKAHYDRLQYRATSICEADGVAIPLAIESGGRA